MNITDTETAATMTADQIETSLRELARLAEMRGETGAAATYRRIADEVEVSILSLRSVSPLTPWRSVPVNRIDGREPTSAEHLAALAEYRETGAIADYVLCELPSDPSPEQIEAACDEGPSVDEIDWTGFDAEIASAGAVIVVFGRGATESDILKRSTTEAADIQLAVDRGLIEGPDLSGEEWVAVVPADTDQAALDADSAVVTYEVVPSDSPALKAWRAA